MVDARQRRLGFLVAGCLFMEILDGTIVSTAAPRIGEALDVPASSVGLVITAYLITLAVLIPLSGWLVARVGARKIFLLGIVVFTAASLLCATSVNLPELVGWRILQGAGAAVMFPVGRLVVLAGTAKADLMRMISYIVWPALIAPVFAPLVGGFITTYASWHWIFLINVPLGVVAFIVAWRIVPAVAPSSPPRLDWVGVVLICLGLGGAVYAASLLAEAVTDWTRVAVVGAPAVLLMAIAVWHLRRTPAPLIDLRTLRVPTFRVSVSSGALAMMAIGAVPFLLPLLFQEVFGWSPVKSGAVVLFVFAGNIGIKPFTTFLLNQFGFRTVLLAAFALFTVSLVGAAFLTASTPIAVIAVVAFASGVARGTSGTAMNTLSFCDVTERQLPHANTFSATVQQLSAGLGVALATIALRVGTPIASGVAGATGPSGAYTVAFLVIAALPMIAAIGVIRLSRDAGDAARTHTAAPAPASA